MTFGKDKSKSQNVKDHKEKPAKQKKVHQPKEVVGFMRALPVILMAIALFLTLCFATAGTGAFGSFMSGLLMGLFSYMAYTIPFLIVIHAVFYFSDVSSGKLKTKITLSIIALTTLSVIAYIIPNLNGEISFNIVDFYKDGMMAKGGGLIGGILGFITMKIFGNVGSIVVILLVIALFAFYICTGGGSDLSMFFLIKLSKIANFGAEIEKKSQLKKQRRKDEKLARQRASDDKKNADFYNDEYFNADNGMSKLEIPELGILEMKENAGGAHILRETVIKNEETDKIEIEKAEVKEDAPAPKRNIFVNIDIDDEPEFVRAENNDGFRKDDIVYEPVSNTENENDDENTVKNETNAEDAFENKTAADFGIDDSAEAIFTADFDPFDIAINERLAEKPSSRAAEVKKKDNAFSEFISDLTEEQAEQKRRLEEFEANRKIALARKAQLEARGNENSVPESNMGNVGSNPLYPNSELSDEDKKAEAIRKLEEERQRAQAELANVGVKEPQNTVFKEEARYAEAAPNSFKENTPPVRNTVNSFNNDYEKQFGAATRSAASAEKYRFVKETLYQHQKEEVRRPYQSTAFSNPTPEYKAKSTPVEVAYSQRADQTNSQHYSPKNDYIEIDKTQKAESGIFETKYQTAANSTDIPKTSVFENLSQKETEEFTTRDESKSENAFAFAKAEESVVNSVYNGERTEFSFGSAEEEETYENEKVFEPLTQAAEIKNSFEEETIEVKRSMLDDSIELTVPASPAVEFSFDEKEDEENFEEAEEEAIAPDIIPENERNPIISEYRNMFTVLDENEDEIASVPEESENEVNFAKQSDSFDDIDYLEENFVDTEIAIDEEDGESDFENFTDEESEEDFEEDMPPFDAPIKKEEKPKPPKQDYSNYKFPPIELLRKSPEEDWDKINEEIQFGGEQLIGTLDSFNIKATIRGMEHGPRITRYSIVPAKGVRVSQIEKLADDIALSLAAESIRIEAPIPGKSAVGVEVPNKVPSIVSLRDLLESDEFQSETSKTCVCIGKSVEGSLVYGDIGSMPHVLIAGATGMGKSVCINSLITSMLYKARPDEVKFIMIDPKKVEFAPYNGIPHLLVPVVTEPKQAAGALMWAVDEMNKRYDIIEKLCVKSIDSYNKKVKENPELGAPMPKIVIFIDELNDLMVQVRDPVENLIMLIAQKARAAGIHLVIGTQRPSVDVITGVIKANIPSRIACKVSSGIDSRTIIEQTGAEKLIGKGDMLFAPSGKAPKRVQGAFVSESETESIVDFIKAQVKGELYDEQALEDMKRAAQKCDKSKNGDDGFDDDDDGESGVGALKDRKFLNAVELAIRNGSVATSFLQRKLHIGYGKAAQYIDTMEDLGIVGEKNGSKARDVLISMDEWNEKLSRLTCDSY